MAYIMAVIYGNVRLLPPDHAYLQPQNIGRFGMRHVMAEAANNLVFDRKHIDQIIIYFTILTGLILLGLQFVLLILAILAQQPAYALGVTDLFPNPNVKTGSLGPEQDIAFMILDRVFGLTGFFNSCISNLGVACTDLQGNNLASTPLAYPFPFHIALHRILQFYSYGIFWIGAMVIIYLFIAIVAETAQSGTPFGQRFNRAWAPVRLIIYLALIIPLNWAGGPNQGLNGAQLITFKIVQLGSNMATNAWGVFNGAGVALPAISASYMSQQYDIVAQPNIPEVNELLQTMYLAHTCKSAYHLQEGPEKKIDAYLVRPRPPAGVVPAVNGDNPALTNDARLFATTDYNQALDFFSRGSITVRFGNLGEEDPASPGSFKDKKYVNYRGNVKPYCGEVQIQIQGVAEPGANDIFRGYYNMLQGLWADPNMINRSNCFVKRKITNKNRAPGCGPIHEEAWAKASITDSTALVQANVQNAIQNQRAGGDFSIPNEILERGWGGAAIWYNRIAAMNGAVTTATLNIPKSTRMPLLMDIAAKSNSQQNQFVSSSKIFNQNMADALGVNVLIDIHDDERNMLTAMTEAYEFWTQGGAGRQTNFSQTTGNIIIDFANSLLGTSGLFEMRKNANVHPLAQLSALGKGMMEAVARNAAYGAAAKGVGSVGFKVDELFGSTGEHVSAFFFTMVITTIGIAVVLYYVLPFLPFIYFMFAISGWIKSIFEAIVAMPLWALAHLRIDGEGLAGPGATNGYFLLLEIFLRPILIVFGFVASINIFSALVNVLNQIFDLVIANLGGLDEELEANIATGAVAGVASVSNMSRGPLDEFFFTAMYAIICYLMGLACFKLVDLIPNNILRWMGVSVSTFQENAGDPAGQLTGNVYKGALLIGNQARGTAKGDFPILAG
ncbi:MAG: DotA/TraY family protein [Rhodospirillales bacterium]|nr:DotA/TraY family protein [Rhodospirillales bacterium]